MQHIIRAKLSCVACSLIMARAAASDYVYVPIDFLLDIRKNDDLSIEAQANTFRARLNIV